MGIEARRRSIGKDFAPHLTRHVGIALLELHAAWVEVASQVDVAGLEHMVKTQVADGIDVAVQSGVDMPGAEEAIPVGVDKNDDFRNGLVVVFDDVSEICHGFIPFVRWCHQSFEVKVHVELVVAVMVSGLLEVVDGRLPPKEIGVQHTNQRILCHDADKGGVVDLLWKLVGDPRHIIRMHGGNDDDPLILGEVDVVQGIGSQPRQ